MTLHRIAGTGLPNVFLKNGYVLDGEGEDQVVSYVDLDGLYHSIAAAIACRSASLTGPEFRFLRRRSGMSQEQVGTMVGKTDQAVAKWEKGQTAVPVVDGNMMRLAWLSVHARRDLPRAVDRMRVAYDGIAGSYVFTYDGAHWRDDAARSIFLPMFTIASTEAAMAIRVAQFTSSAAPTILSGATPANGGIFKTKRKEGMT